MIKKIVLAVLLAAMPTLPALAAQSANGTLLHPINGVDFHYLPWLSKPYSSLQNGGTIMLQARFIWGGPSGGLIQGDEHAIVAFTQGSRNDVVNTSGQPLWTHGAGAFVHPNGLHMELWQSKPGGLHTNVIAYVWGQDPNYGLNCVERTDGAIVRAHRVLCLSKTPSAAGYLTPSQFSLRKGVAYSVRLKLIRQLDNPEYVNLQADLLEDTPHGAVLRQQALVGFRSADFLPYTDQELRASVARTPNSNESIQYYAFDYGF